MTPQESLEFAREQLRIAQASRRFYEAEKWQFHIDHWELVIQRDELLAALESLLPIADNWACNCEINGEGKNNPSAHTRAVISKVKEHKNGT